MGWGPIRPAAIDFGDPAAPRAPAFGDVYHSRAGAQAQARAVFLAGNGLPERWAGRARFVVLETGFGLGHNFLATWAAWRRSGAAACERLVFVSVEKHPPTRDDLARAHAQAHDDALLRHLSAALVTQWPPTTPDVHVLDFDGGRMRLLLAFGDVQQVLPDLVLQADAVYLDGFAPRVNAPMWSPEVLNTLPRVCAPGATLATWSVAVAVRDGLARQGFEVQTRPGFGGKREMTVARFAPRHVPTPPPGRRAQPGVCAVAVVGAGLAGAAAARALAREGLTVTVLDRRPGPAMETSGNAGGLYHSVLHAHDGAHARWLRAAALHTARVLAPLIATAAVPGALDGLLRGERRLGAAAMQALLDAQAQPPAHVTVQVPGVAGAEAAWCFTGGGWVAPGALVARWLAESGAALRLDSAVQALERLGDDSLARWRLRGEGGRVLLDADAVVLCNAGDTVRLLGDPGWPLQRVRGQTTILPADAVAAAGPALTAALRLPIADGGYALRLADGRVLCGASPHPDDEDSALRDADHLQNLHTLRRLTGWTGAVALATLDGRVGHRLAADDRLPIVGPVPVEGTDGRRAPTQARWMPRAPGLFVLTALGSRGITQAALAGEVLAARLTGAPVPLASGLLDAIDPARFAVRGARQAG